MRQLNQFIRNKTSAYRTQMSRIIGLSVGCFVIGSKRMRFYNYKTGETGNQPTFKASYFGVNLFKSQIILADIDIK